LELNVGKIKKSVKGNKNKTSYVYGCSQGDVEAKGPDTVEPAISSSQNQMRNSRY